MLITDGSHIEEYVLYIHRELARNSWI